MSMRHGLIAVVLALVAFAPARAGELIAEVNARLAKPEFLRGQFEQAKTITGFSRPLQSQGDFLLWREHGLLWQTRSPFAAQMVLTRTQLSQRAGAADLRLDSSREPALMVANELFLALLAGDLGALSGRFGVTGELVGKSGWRIELTPREAALARHLKRIELHGDRYVRRVHFGEANGDQTQIRFSAHAESPAASPAEAAQLGR